MFSILVRLCLSIAVVLLFSGHDFAHAMGPASMRRAVAKPAPAAAVPPVASGTVVKHSVTNKDSGRKILVPFKSMQFKGKSFKQAATTSLKSSLPDVLTQLKVPKAKVQAHVAKGTTVLANAVLVALGNREPPATHVRRNIFGDIGNWVKGVVNDIVGAAEDAGCGIFSVSALPAYLTAAGIFAVENHGSTSTSAEQDFFIHPLHGDISHNAPVSVFYRASFPPGFSDVAATTIGRNVYVRSANVPKDPSTSLTSVNGGFLQVTKLLQHELTHSEQYQSVSWNLAAFGTEYLYQYCKGGFKYQGNSMEVRAFQTQELTDGLLQDSLGVLFFKVWRAKSLSTLLGLPTSTKYSMLTSATKYRELPFQRGIIQAQGTNCFRILTGTNLAIRNGAKCSLTPPPPPPCKVKKPGRCPKRPKFNPAPCKKKIQAWADLSKKLPWDCTLRSG